MTSPVSTLPASASPASTMSASAQANAAWAKILTSPQPPATLEWPSFSDLKTKVGDADYNHILQCPLDFSSSSTGADKTLCPHGCVARCSIEWIPPPPDSAGEASEQSEAKRAIGEEVDGEEQAAKSCRRANALPAGERPTCGRTTERRANDRQAQNTLRRATG